MRLGACLSQSHHSIGRIATKLHQCPGSVQVVYNHQMKGDAAALEQYADDLSALIEQESPTSPSVRGRDGARPTSLQACVRPLEPCRPSARCQGLVLGPGRADRERTLRQSARSAGRREGQVGNVGGGESRAEAAHSRCSKRARCL